MPRKQLLRVEKPQPKAAPKTPPVSRPPQPAPAGAGHPLLRLHGTIGNRAMSGLVQTKLAINQPGDRYEQEADRVAGRVMRMPSRGGSALFAAPQTVQRQCAACASGQGQCATCAAEEKLQRKPLVATNGSRIQRQAAALLDEEQGEPEGTVQTKPISSRPSPAAQRQAESGEENGASVAGEEEGTLQPKRVPGPAPSAPPWLNVGQLAAGGSPLPENMRAFYEARLGYDLSQVRIHFGSEAERRSRVIQAHAFTLGHHIWLGQNQRPEPSFLMAHELVHVVQQKQPKRLATGQNHAATPRATFAPPAAAPLVQRAFYWAPGLREPVSGGKIHGELTPKIANENSVLDEIPIPNADRDANVGLDFKGQADFYRGQQIGLYFQKSSTRIMCGEHELGAPVTLPGGGQKGKPKVRAGKIIQANNAPTNIEMGELKPADPGQLAFGARQLTAYEDGIKLAREQTNCWLTNAAKPGKKPAQWPAVSFKRLALKPPAKYEYKPDSPGKSRSLVVASYTGASSRSTLGLPGKSEGEGVKLEFSPFKEFGKTIMGDLYAVDAGNGLVAYFARPANPKEAYKLARLAGRDEEAATTLATQLQNEVIDPIFQAPQKVAPLAWSRGKIEGGSPPTAPPAVSPGPRGQVQRKKAAIKKTPKLVDTFKFAPWNRRREKLATDFNRGKGSKAQKSLQFLDLMYQAEASLDSVSGVPKPSMDKRLPPKSQDEVTLGPDPKAKGKTKPKPRTKKLADLFGWMKAWTSPPIMFLGKLRATFGKSFVKVAQFVADLRTRLQGRLDQARNKEKKKGGTSYAAIAVRAFWRAAAKIGALIFRETIALLVDSLTKGLQKKLADLIPFDDAAKLQELVDNDFPALRAIEKRLADLEAEAKKQIDAVVSQFDEEMKILSDLAEKARKYGKYIKWAMIALQCATPPGWGCLKLLAKRLVAKVIEEILSWCWTQEKFQSLVLATGWFDKLPNTLAEGAADKIEGILPAGVTPVFDRSVFTEIRPPQASDIPCGEEPSAQQIAIAEVHDSLQEKLGPEGYKALTEALEKYGVPPSEELTIEQIQAIREKIPEGVTPEEIKEFLDAVSTSKLKRGKTIDVAEFLEVVKKTVRERRIKGAGQTLKSDEFAEQLAALGPNQIFVAVSKTEIDRGRAVSTTVIEKGSKDKPDAAGVADLDIDKESLDCSQGEVEIKFTKVEIFDESDNPITSVWEGKAVKLRMNDLLRKRACPTSGE